MSGPLYLLDAESLCSKWGFGDGDSLDEWWMETYGEVTINTHDLLYLLVVTYLVLVITEAGYVVEIERIETNHNPVRASTINGVEVDHLSDQIFFTPEIRIWLNRSQIEETVALHDLQRTSGRVAP